MRQRKFIICKDWNDKNVELRIGYVFYHRDLMDKSDEKNKIDFYGGGRWDVDWLNRKIVLYGSSDDFGKPNKKDIERAIKNLKPYDWWVIEHAVYGAYEDHDGDLIDTMSFEIQY